MKRLSFTLFVLLSFCLTAVAQTGADSLVKKYKLNFAIPDFPAFKALGTNPGNLLRPSNVEDFGVAASQFFNGTGLIVPSSFALELNPILVFNRNQLSLRDYQDKSFLRTSRVSIGTYTDSGMLSNLALGYRVSLIDKGDLRTDQKYLTRIFEVMARREKLKRELTEEYIRENNLKATQLSDEDKKAIARYISENLARRKVELDQQVQEMRDEYLEKNWNAEKLDFAVAWVGQSADSLLKNVRYSAFNTWLTWSLPAFKEKGQFLLGGYYRNYLSEGKSLHSASLSSRLYIGSNRFKGFAEAQGQYVSLTESASFWMSLGAELNVYNGIWIDFNAGLIKDFKANTSRFTNQFTFRYTLPK